MAEVHGVTGIEHRSREAPGYEPQALTTPIAQLHEEQPEGYKAAHGYGEHYQERLQDM